MLRIAFVEHLVRDCFVVHVYIMLAMTAVKCMCRPCGQCLLCGGCVKDVVSEFFEVHL